MIVCLFIYLFIYLFIDLSVRLWTAKPQGPITEIRRIDVKSPDDECWLGAIGLKIPPLWVNGKNRIKKTVIWQALASQILFFFHNEWYSQLLLDNRW